jgi:hypothetical protein
MRANLLPPSDFNPTVFTDDLPNGCHRIRIECFSREIATIEVDPATKPNRQWGQVILRWSRFMIYREYQKWLELYEHQ